MPRLQAEVLPGLPFEPITFPWYEPDRRQQLMIELTHGGAVGSDIAAPDMHLMTAAVTALRYQLTPEEQQRLRDLAARTGAAIETAAGEIAPGMREYAIAGLLAEECFLRDITPLLLLVGTDDRVERFRHPLPTSKPLERYAMLVLSARRWGLVANVTRLIHFGPIPADLQQRAAACARIDAAMIAATRLVRLCPKCSARSRPPMLPKGIPIIGVCTTREEQRVMPVVNGWLLPIRSKRCMQGRPLPGILPYLASHVKIRSCFKLMALKF